PMNGIATTTSWTSTVDLTRGQLYFGRCWATDDRGAQSGYSNVNRFTIKPNQVPPPPLITSPSGALCQTGVIKDAAPTSITVSHVIDPDGDPVMLNVQVFDTGSQ